MITPQQFRKWVDLQGGCLKAAAGIDASLHAVDLPYRKGNIPGGATLLKVFVSMLSEDFFKLVFERYAEGTLDAESLIKQLEGRE